MPKRVIGLGIFWLLSLFLASTAFASEVRQYYKEFIYDVIDNPSNYNSETYGYSGSGLADYSNFILFWQDHNMANISEMVADNHFAIADINGDGEEELLFKFSNESGLTNAGQLFSIFKYDSSTGAVRRIGNASRQEAIFYDNGYLLAWVPRDYTSGNAIAPSDIFKYNGSIYEYVGHVFCHESGADGDYASPNYSSDKDYDSDGVIYYFNDSSIDRSNVPDISNPLTFEEYNEIISGFIGGANQIKEPTWYNITKSNADKLENVIEQEPVQDTDYDELDSYYSYDDSIKVYVNGSRLSFDQEPVIREGRVLVPLRAVFEALGADDISWDNYLQTVTAYFQDNGILIQMTVGEMFACINGVNVELDVPPINYNGRILIPVRFVAEELYYEVTWDSDTRTVDIVDN